jgi:hypothetical protein
MTGIEQNQARLQQDHAVVDALMSDDAARAIEILRRTVVYGTPVPDPDVVDTLVVQPTHPGRAFRRHAWIRTAVPLAISLAAIIGSLGWSYADYSDRQEKWQQIAEEQTALADQRAQHIAEYDAWKEQVLTREAEHAAWKQSVLKREAETQARRERIAQRFQGALEAGKLDEAALQLSAFGDWIATEKPSPQDQIDRFSIMMDQLVESARRTAKETTNVSQ